MKYKIPALTTFNQFFKENADNFASSLKFSLQAFADIVLKKSEIGI